MERNCPNKGKVDATSAATRQNAHVCSLALAGDDSGETTLEELEERFGGLDEVRGFVNAVREQSEQIMVGAGLHTSHTLVSAHSCGRTGLHTCGSTGLHIPHLTPRSAWSRIKGNS